MNSVNSTNILKGVNCDAKDCIHHDGIANCKAEFINIKIKNSILGANVNCESFVQK